MKEFVEKLISRLQEATYDMEICEEQFDMNSPYFMDVDYKMVKFDDAKTIINELAEEYNNGWIPCSERLPEPGKRYLVSCIVKTGDIEEYTVWHAIYAGSRGWYADNGKPLNAEIIAWQYLPEPYKPQQESKDINVNKIVTIDYNELFKELQKSCERENCCNAFRYISLGELEELNNLLDRLLLFCENIKREELEDYEFGNKVFELYELADTLFSRDC